MLKRCGSSWKLATLVFAAALLRLGACLLTGDYDADGRICDRYLEAIYSRQTVVSVPPKLQGLWVSSGCETRPGPEFLIRRYQFVNDTHFSALQFHYTDSSCTDPFYGLEARGFVKVDSSADAPDRLSWRPSAYELISPPMLLQATAMPYTVEAAKYLQRKATTTSRCRRQLPRGNWSPSSGPYHLLIYVEYENKILRDFDCTEELGFNLHEMQLLRVEQVRLATAAGAGWTRQLHVGDIATSMEARQRHRPSGFQRPLEDATNSNCPAACRKVISSSLKRPPVLSWRALLSTHPAGEWVSTVCESRPQSNYVTRRLRFDPVDTGLNQSAGWSGTYHHFHDPQCRKPYFSVTATGHVRSLGPEPSNLDARQFDFDITGLAITPQDKKSLDQLNAYSGYGCGRTAWKLNRTQDVTDTNGCDHFRLHVPFRSEQAMIQELVGEDTWLFVGAIANTPAPANAGRPTSFQPPLVRCRDLSATRGLWRQRLGPPQQKQPPPPQPPQPPLPMPTPLPPHSDAAADVGSERSCSRRTVLSTAGVQLATSVLAFLALSNIHFL